MIKIGLKDSMRLETLFEKLNKCPLIQDVKYININKFGFSRNISFKIRGKEYELCWYINIITLTTPDLSIRFKEIEITDTWPTTDSKYDLLLKIEGEYVGRIKLDEGEKND